VFEPEEQALRQLETEGLATIEGRKIALTSEGRPLMRIVAAIFDTYLSNSPAATQLPSDDAGSSVPRQGR
jgi:coproporphyrinogen III oxidase-like Fe-S oxidoreductase